MTSSIESDITVKLHKTFEKNDDRNIFKLLDFVQANMADLYPTPQPANVPNKLKTPSEVIADHQMKLKEADVSGTLSKLKLLRHEITAHNRDRYFLDVHVLDEKRVLHSTDVAKLIEVAKTILSDLSVLFQETGLLFTANGTNSTKRLVERLDAFHKQMNASVVASNVPQSTILDSPAVSPVMLQDTQKRSG